MYMNTLVHCHFCIEIITDHFLLSMVSCPIHTIPGINAHLLYPILCPWKYFIRHKLLYCPVCIFGCFHGNQRCVASYHYFYTWGVLQEVNIISTVRPYILDLLIMLISFLHATFMKLGENDSTHELARKLQASSKQNASIKQENFSF